MKAKVIFSVFAKTEGSDRVDEFGIEREMEFPFTPFVGLTLMMRFPVDRVQFTNDTGEDFNDGDEISVPLDVTSVEWDGKELSLHGSTEMLAETWYGIKLMIEEIKSFGWEVLEYQSNVRYSFDHH